MSLQPGKLYCVSHGGWLVYEKAPPLSTNVLEPHKDAGYNATVAAGYWRNILRMRIEVLHVDDIFMVLDPGDNDVYTNILTPSGFAGWILVNPSNSSFLKEVVMSDNAE